MVAAHQAKVQSKTKDKNFRLGPCDTAHYYQAGRTYIYIFHHNLHQNDLQHQTRTQQSDAAFFPTI